MDNHPLISPQRFKQVMSRFTTGVTVVTTAMEGRLYGLTLNAFCSVSLEPPLVLICVDQMSRNTRFIAESGIFAVNVLSWRHQFLADRFAGRAPVVNTAFEGVPHFIAQTGAPILEGTLSWLDCRMTEHVILGDHVAFIGTVLAGEVDGKQEPLLFYNNRFLRLSGQE